MSSLLAQAKSRILDSLSMTERRIFAVAFLFHTNSSSCLSVFL
jgi:hypothetical protein